MLYPGNPSVLGQMDMQITLIKRCWDLAIPKRGYKINGAVLTDEAFVPKKYTLTLEHGRFITADQAMLPTTYLDSYTEWFAFRLSFNPSPYPPREQWKAAAGVAADALRFWEWKEFCSGRL